VHAYVDAELEKRSKWAKTTIHDVEDLVGDRTDTMRTQSDFKEPPLSLTSTKSMPPKNIFLVQSSYPKSYGETVRNCFWESAM
jgi:hypothetical protein